MANEYRVRASGVQGTITNNPLLVGATTMNGAGLADLPAIGATQFAAITLDPLGTAGAPEVVWVTAHTASATSATIVRAREGTTARQHASGTAWVHGPTPADYLTVAAAASLPSGGGLPYIGESAYQYDGTNDEGLWLRNTAGQWRKSWNMPWGVVGYTARTSDFTPIAASNTITDVTSLSVTFTAVANRYVRLSVVARVATAGTADQASVYIRESSTTLAQSLRHHVLALGQDHVISCIVTPTAGSHTYKVSASQSNGATGTFQASATYPAYILAEDIGPNGAAA